MYLRKRRLNWLRGGRWGLIELSAPLFVLPIPFVILLFLPSVFLCKIGIPLTPFFEALIHRSTCHSRFQGHFEGNSRAIRGHFEGTMVRKFHPASTNHRFFRRSLGEIRRNPLDFRGIPSRLRCGGNYSVIWWIIHYCGGESG